MPFPLPHDFDTRRETRLMLKGVLVLLAVMLLAGLVMLVARHDLRGAAGTLLFDAVLVAFAVVLLRALPGAEGRITQDGVEARARRVWGIALPGPVGTFARDDFRAVRVERVLASGNGTSLHLLERVMLAGKPGTPDVRVLSGRVDGDASPGEALAAALQLPCEIVREPRRIVLRRSR